MCLSACAQSTLAAIYMYHVYSHNHVLSRRRVNWIDGWMHLASTIEKREHDTSTICSSTEELMNEASAYEVRTQTRSLRVLMQWVNFYRKSKKASQLTLNPTSHIRFTPKGEKMVSLG